MAPTGHSRIKALLAETGAPLAGEMSGHIFFADKYFGYDDAIYVAVRLLAILARADPTLAEMVDESLHVINTPELRLALHRGPQIRDRRGNSRSASENAARKVSDIDGVRVSTADGWWLVRASNTQAIVVARAEATTEAGFARVKQELADELAASGLSLPE